MYSTRRSGILIGRSVWIQCFVCAWGGVCLGAWCVHGALQFPAKFTAGARNVDCVEAFSTSIECTSGTWWANDRCRPCLY
jgi:hypothetical protein